MRLFIGIELSDELRRAAAALSERIRSRMQRAAPSSIVRWVPGENLHITLWFLGEVQAPKIETLLDALREPLDSSPFTLRLGNAGAFPHSGAPRTIWLGVTSGHDRLVSVHDCLGPRLTPLGFRAEKRAYSPHLTIARVKDARPSDFTAIRRTLADPIDVGGECDIRIVTLFRSRTAPSGSQYEVLLRTPLAAD